MSKKVKQGTEAPVPMELEEVKIKKRIWSKKNLRVTAFKNGDEILEAKTDKEWKEAHKKKKPNSDELKRPFNF